MFDEFHINGKLNACIKENFICLIPKKEESQQVKDFRPISLTASSYKIITKVLAERLKKVMSSLISNTQRVFIGGRQILDPVLIANETVKDYRAKKKKRDGFLNWIWKRPSIE